MVRRGGYNEICVHRRAPPRKLPSNDLVIIIIICIFIIIIYCFRKRTSPERPERINSFHTRRPVRNIIPSDSCTRRRRNYNISNSMAVKSLRVTVQMHHNQPQQVKTTTTIITTTLKRSSFTITTAVVRWTDGRVSNNLSNPVFIYLLFTYTGFDQVVWA